MLPPKKPAQSVAVSKHRTIYFVHPQAYLNHLKWEGEMWDELSKLTLDDAIESCDSNLGECAVATSLDFGMAFEIDALPATTIIH